MDEKVLRDYLRRALSWHESHVDWKKAVANVQLRQPVRFRAAPRVVDREHVNGREADLLVYLVDIIRQTHFIGAQLGAPALQPVVDDLAIEIELLAGGRVHPREVSPDGFRLVEHGRLQLTIRTGAREILAQRPKRGALQQIGADRLARDEERGQRHEREPQEQLALERHREIGSARDRGTTSVRLRRFVIPSKGVKTRGCNPGVKHGRETTRARHSA